MRYIFLGYFCATDVVGILSLADVARPILRPSSFRHHRKPKKI